MKQVALEQTLAICYPELASQWHPTKNQLLSPNSYAVTSSKKVWWECTEGHEYLRAINHRVRNKACPVCTGRLIIPGTNDLATTHPHLFEQWDDDIDPVTVHHGNSTKVWWKCSHGHRWQAAVHTRSRTGCPYCSGLKPIVGETDLDTTHPDLVSQWHPDNATLPTEVSAGSTKRITWVCDLEHTWEASVDNRSKGTGCPVCAGRKIVIGFNDLATTHPQLIADWAEPTLSPTEVISGSGKKVSWRCSKGHEWVASVVKRAHSGQGCPVCSGHITQSGFNDLQTTLPVLAGQWHETKNFPLDPSVISSGSGQKVWWQCEQNHEWVSSICDRKRGNGCPRCSCSGPSLGEQALGDWLVSLGVEVVRNNRQMVKGYELDIYLPEYNFAIEYNGLYWHSEANGKDKNYHKTKADIVRSTGITLFQVWEDDWFQNSDIIKRMILHRVGLSHERSIFARKTSVVTLSTAQAHSFLEKNHVQGKANGRLYLGLLEKGTDNLVAVMVLKQIAGGVVYLERYATSCRVPGGFTRLLKQTIELLSPTKIITFADQSISDGNLYEKNGFVVDGILPPDYSYLVKGKRVHKFNYRLKRFREDPDLLFEEGMSERELALLNKLHRIWDSGKIRYVLEP